MMSLVYAKTGETVEVVRIVGGKGISSHLATMGIYPGVKLKVISSAGFGPLIVAVNETRIGLGRNMARRIFVKI